MTIQFRRGTSGDISAANPTPAAGQPIFETDTRRLKIGDGYTSYNMLPFVHDAATEYLDGYVPVGSDELVPAGGSAGQFLAKASGNNYDLTWSTPEAVVGSLSYNIILDQTFELVSSTGPVDVPGFYFTPEANKKYKIEAMLLVQTSVTTTGPRPGFSPPTVATYTGAVRIPNSETTESVRNYRNSLTAVLASTGMAVANMTYLAAGDFYIDSGPTPSGNLQVTLSAEDAAATVRMMAGSFLRVSVLNEGIDLGYLNSIFDGYATESEAEFALDGYLNDAPVEVNLYVSEDGYNYNPGTQALPYRQPQDAINYIVTSKFSNGSIFNIYCGAGTFNAPDTSMVPANITVRIFADLSAPIIDGYSTAPAPTLEDGYAGLWVIITNGYTGTYSGNIYTGTHWVYNSGFQTGAVAYHSTSPEVRIVSDGYVLWPIHITEPQFDLLEYKTTFVCSDPLVKFIGHTNSLFTNINNYFPYSNIEYFGIHFDFTSLNAFEFERIKLTGCKFTQSVGADPLSRKPIGSVVLNNCYANIITILEDGSKLIALNGTAFSGIFYNQVDMGSSHLHSGIFHNGLRILEGSNILGFNGLHGFDLRNNGITYYSSTIHQESNSTAQSLNTYLAYGSLSRSHGMVFSVNSSRTISGNVSTGFSILNAILSNIEETCDGNLTCSSADVEFGGGASTVTFAGLPATDAGDTTPYFARVS